MDKYELLDRVLEGSATEAEEQQLQQLLAKDAELQSQAQLLLKLHDAGMRTLAENSKVKREVPTVITLKPWYYAAASVLVLLGIVFWLKNHDGPNVAAGRLVTTKLPVYELRDSSMGFSRSGQASDSMTIEIKYVSNDTIPAYFFKDYELLRLRLKEGSPKPEFVLRLTESDYQLVTGQDSVTVVLGREIWQPLPVGKTRH